MYLLYRRKHFHVIDLGLGIDIIIIPFKVSREIISKGEDR